MGHKYQLLLFILCTTLTAFGTEAGFQIRASESGSVREVYFDYALNADGEILTPNLRMDAAAGEFQLTFAPIDTAAFTGTRFLRQTGDFPLHLNVFFANDTTIVLKGRTTPFDDVALYYRFDTFCYVLEIYSASSGGLAGAPVLQRSYDGGPGKDTIAKPIRRGAKSTVSANDNHVLESMIRYSSYVVLILAFTLISLLLIRWYRPAMTIRRKKSTVESMEPTAPNNEAHDPEMSAEERDRMIRGMMAEQSIPYDEAALRVEVGVKSDEFTE